MNNFSRHFNKKSLGYDENELLKAIEVIMREKRGQFANKFAREYIRDYILCLLVEYYEDAWFIDYDFASSVHGLTIKYLG